MKLDERAITALSQLADPIGIISLYVGVPVERANDRPSWPIEVKHLLHGLENNLKATLPNAEWRRVHDRIIELEPQIDALLDSRGNGRGRALFAPVSDGRLETVAVQLELPTTVVFEKEAFLEPLVGALDEGRPAGMLTLHRHGVRAFEWRLEETEQLAEWSFEPDEDEWRRMTGPTAPNPARGAQVSVNEERYKRRLEANRWRFLEGIAVEVGALLDQRRWERLVVFGDPRLTRPFVEVLPATANALEIFYDDRLIDDSSIEAIHQHVRPILHEAQKQREVSLVERARDMALSRGRACLGLQAVLEALNMSRVEHLLIDASKKFPGFRSDDGQLFSAADPNVGPEMIREENLVEHIVKRALATNAKVTPVEERAAAELEEHGGIGALSRW